MEPDYRQVVLATVAILALQSTVLSAEPGPSAEGPEVQLAELSHIRIPPDPLDAERSMAAVLQEKLQALYGVRPTISTASVGRGADGIFMGRRMAMRSGMISDNELSAVKFDGFVIKGSGNRIALAGYAPQGTIYATYALLRRLGLKLYPWRHFGAVEVHQPLEGGRLAPFTVASKPFFSRRDLLGYLDQGRWGASLREYSFGEFRFVQDHEYFKRKGWLGGDHTAPYLVPMAKYYDTHPEYFAMKGGERIPKDTPNVRVALCLSNPEVRRIAAERALEWMAIQDRRRFFHVTDGDTSECRCPQCVAMDPHPDSYTDRYLTWVNSVARAVKPAFPDNVIMAIAYANATRPPVEVKPESNVVVMYCPWYWNSRTTSAVGWANPLNVTAMKEFMAWAMMFPDQMGLYDYPGSWVFGQADRIKFLAKHGARVFYACGGHGDLYQWMGARLLWDPFLNPEDLMAEFVAAYYGGAAEPMRRYLLLRQETIARNLVHCRHPFRDAAFLRETRDLMRQAQRLAEGADKPTQARVLAGVLDGLHLVLSNTHPHEAGPGLGAAPEPYRKEVEQFVRLSKRLQETYEDLGNQYVARLHKDEFRKRVEALGIDLPPSEKEGESAADTGEPFDTALALFENYLKGPGGSKQHPREPASRSLTQRFDSPSECDNWLSDGSQVDLITPAAMTAIDYPSIGARTGVGIDARLTGLPVIAHHKMKIHAGRFYAERVFDPPLDVTGCFFLDFHAHASCDVPVTVYVNEVHSDVDLHAGEQIVRVDMRNFDRPGRFTYADWDKKVRRIGFDVWPQDNYYPYPEVQNTRVVFFGMTAGDRKPEPDVLPYRGKAIWLSRFRPNLSRGIVVPRDLYDRYMQRQHYRHVGLDYGSRWISERFRTFTEHRCVTPIFAILTSPSASPGELETAKDLQRFLDRMFGVRLPVNPREVTVGRNTGNAILAGKQACLAAGRVKEQELRHVGPEGLVIHACQGRVAIAGSCENGTRQGVARYLEDHGVRIFERGRVEVPDLSNDFLHELYLLDWPYFRDRPIQGVWQLVEPGGSAAATESDSVTAARELAEAVKNVARTGKDTLPATVAAEIGTSPLSRYVGARLLWDPFADVTRLIRQFEE